MVRVGAEIDPSFNSSFDGASGKMQDFSDDADNMAGQYSAAVQKVVAAQLEADQAWDTAKGTFAELQQAFDSGYVSFETLARGAEDLKSAFDEANPSLKAIKDSAGEAESGVKTLAEAFTEITGIALTFEALKEAATETVTAFGNEQAATIALTAALEGNKNEAIELIEQAKGMADALGQSNSSVIGATQALIAFGVPADNIRTVLQGMGTAALASNNPLDTISQRFDSMASTGSLANRSLVSLRLTVDDIGAAMDKAGEPTADIKAAFLSLGDTAARAGVIAEAELSKFPTLAADAADSVNNAWNSVKNATENAFVEVGAQLGGFTALVTPIVQAIKGIETGFLALLLPVKVVVDAVVGGGGIILSTLTGLGQAAVDTAQGKFGEASEDIKGALARAASYASGFIDNVKSDWTSSATAIAAIWDTSMKSVGDGASGAKKPIEDLSASQQELNQASKDLLAGAALLGDVWRKSQQPVLDLGQATTNLAVAQAHQQQAAQDLLKAQNDLSNASNQEVPNAEAVTDAIAAQQTAYKNVQAATKDVAQAQKDLQAAQKLAEQATKDQSQTDGDYATMLNTLGKGSLLNYADAIANVSAAKSKYVDAVTNEITIQGQLDGLIASGKQGTADYTTAQGALTAAHQQVSQALKDLNAAQTIATGSQTALSGATKELLTDQTSLDGLYKDHLTGDTIDLQTAVAALSTARQNEAEAANDLITAEGNLAVVKATATSSEGDLKTATDNARIARENLTKATKDTADAEGTVTQQFGLSKTAADVLSGATVSLTEVFKDLGLKSASSLQDLATAAQKEYTLIATSGSSSANQVRDAQIKALQDQKAAYIANGTDLSSAQQQTLDTLLNQQSYFNQQHADQWHALYTTIDNQVMQLSDKLVQDLFEGNGSFGKTALKALEDLGAAVANAFIAPATKAIADFIAGSLSNLGSTLGGLVSGFTSLGTAAADTASTVSLTFFGGASQAASATTGVMGALKSATSALSGIVSAVAGIAGAVAGIVGDIETAHSNTLLDRIEHETARMAIYLGDQGENSILGLMWRLANDLEFGMSEKDLNIIAPDVDAILKAMSSLTVNAGGGSSSISGVVTVNDPGNVASIPTTQTNPIPFTDVNAALANYQKKAADYVAGKASGDDVNAAEQAVFLAKKLADAQAKYQSDINAVFSGKPGSLTAADLAADKQAVIDAHSVTTAGPSTQITTVGELATANQALSNINTTLQFSVGLNPWFQTAFQNINDGIVACAGWLQGIAGIMGVVQAEIPALGTVIAQAAGGTSPSGGSSAGGSAGDGSGGVTVPDTDAMAGRDIAKIADLIDGWTDTLRSHMQQIGHAISIPSGLSGFTGAPSLALATAQAGGGDVHFHFNNPVITSAEQGRKILDEAVNQLRRRNRII